MLTYPRATCVACLGACALVPRPALAQGQFPPDVLPLIEVTADVGAGVHTDDIELAVPPHIIDAAVRLRLTSRYAVGVETLQVLVPWHSVNGGVRDDRTRVVSIYGITQRGYLVHGGRWLPYLDGFFGFCDPHGGFVEHAAAVMGFGGDAGLDVALTHSLRLGASLGFLGAIPLSGGSSADDGASVSSSRQPEVPQLTVFERVGFAFTAF